MQSSQKAEYDKAKQSAKLLRGEVIDLFAQVEHAVGEVLAHAATLPEYKALKPALPHLMGQKLERLRELISKPSPLKSRVSGIAPLVDKLALFEELRHFMAHGIVDVALKQSGDPIYEFRMLASKGLPESLLLTRREAQSRTARLSNIAKDVVSKLDSISKNRQPQD